MPMTAADRENALSLLNSLIETIGTIATDDHQKQVGIDVPNADGSEVRITVLFTPFRAQTTTVTQS